MPPGLPPCTVTSSGLSGAVSLPGRRFPFPAVLGIPVVLRSKPPGEVEAVVKDAEGELTVA